MYGYNIKEVYSLWRYSDGGDELDLDLGGAVEAGAQRCQRAHQQFVVVAFHR